MANNTHCSYQKKSVKRDGNSLVVVARFFEGLFENVEEPSLENPDEMIIVNRYVPKDIVGNPVSIIFDKFPVEDSEIIAELDDLLSDISQLPKGV